MRSGRPGVGAVLRGWRSCLVDCAVWALAVVAAVWARFDFDPSAVQPGGVATVAIMAIGAQLAIGYLLGVYRSRYWPGSVEEAKAVGITVLSTGNVPALERLIGQAGRTFGMERHVLSTITEHLGADCCAREGRARGRAGQVSSGRGQDHAERPRR